MVFNNTPSGHGLAPKDVNAVANQEIIRAKALIVELKLNNETAHQLMRSIGNLLTVQRLLLEQIHRTHTILQAQSSVGRKSNNTVFVFAVNMTEERATQTTTR